MGTARRRELYFVAASSPEADMLAVGIERAAFGYSACGADLLDACQGRSKVDRLRRLNTDLLWRSRPPRR
jgi:hypothetical protein